VAGGLIDSANDNPGQHAARGVGNRATDYGFLGERRDGSQQDGGNHQRMQGDQSHRSPPSVWVTISVRVYTMVTLGNQRIDAGMNIGFIGLGPMGGRMAASLRAAGHELYVNDIRPEAVAPHVAAGAVAGTTAREIGEVSEIVFTSLPGPAEFSDVTVGERGL